MKLILCLILDCVGGLGGCGVGYGRFLLGVWLTVGRGGLQRLACGGFMGVVRDGSDWFLIHPMVGYKICSLQK